MREYIQSRINELLEMNGPCNSSSMRWNREWNCGLKYWQVDVYNLSDMDLVDFYEKVTMLAFRQM